MDRGDVKVDVRQFFDCPAQFLFPAGVHKSKFRIISLEAPVSIKVQFVVLVEKNLERGPDGHIGAHRGVERKQSVGSRDLQAGGIVLNAAIRIGRPYLTSPICKYGEPSVALRGFPWG